MIVYDNQAQFRILFKKVGSVVPSALPIGVFCLTYGATLAILRHLGRLEEVLPAFALHVRRPFCLQCTAVVAGYLLVVRTNMALGRWMHGVAEVQTMLSKWADAFDALNGFFAARAGTEEERIRITNFRVRIAHWFSLMSCLAFATLRHGSQGLNLDDVPIRELFAEEGAPEPKARSFTASKGGAAWTSEMASGLMQNLELFVLSEPTEEELSLLTMSHDKVNTISLWIIQGTILEIRALTLDAPPPIVSRIFQELSNGMLGFAQAHKVAIVPFPFPFAQMVTLLCTVLYLTLPFYIDQFTKNVIFTPILSFILPMCYCGLNRIAIELEEPFGTDTNDVDIDVRHLEFVYLLMDVLKQPMESPISDGFSLERRILRGIHSRASEFERDHIAQEVARYMVPPVVGSDEPPEQLLRTSIASSGSAGPASSTDGASISAPEALEVTQGAEAEAEGCILELIDSVVELRYRDRRRVTWEGPGLPEAGEEDGWDMPEPPSEVTTRAARPAVRRLSPKKR